MHAAFCTPFYGTAIFSRKGHIEDIFTGKNIKNFFTKNSHSLTAYCWLNCFTKTNFICRSKKPINFNSGNTQHNVVKMNPFLVLETQYCCYWFAEIISCCSFNEQEKISKTGLIAGFKKL